MPPFKKVRNKPLMYMGALEPTPEREHYLVCCPPEKTELYHLKRRAELKGEPPIKSLFKIHLYCYSLPDMEHRQTLLYYRRDFGLSPLISAAYLAEACTKFLYSQVKEVAAGKLPPRSKSLPRAYLLPGVQAETHWRAVINACLKDELKRGSSSKDAIFGR